MSEVLVTATPSSDANAVRTVDEWAEVIRETYCHSLESILDVGLQLLQAKVQLGGDYTAMINTDVVPFGERQARQYTAIAKCGELRALIESLRDPNNFDESKRQCAAALPPTVDALATLSRLPEGRVGVLINEGRVSPALTNAQAQLIVRTIRARETETHLVANIPVPANLDGPLGRDIRDDLNDMIKLGIKVQCWFADCPWAFTAHSKLGDSKNPSNHYPTMSIDELCSLPVADICADNCAGFMWRPDWDEDGSLEVIKAWGFKVATLQVFNWQKTWPDGPQQAGSGYWTQSEGEIVTLCTRGSPSRIDTKVRRTIFQPAFPNEHSRKPDGFLHSAAKLVAGPGVELFARRQTEGWICLGNEVPSPLPGMLEKAGLAA